MKDRACVMLNLSHIVTYLVENCQKQMLSDALFDYITLINAYCDK